MARNESKSPRSVSQTSNRGASKAALGVLWSVDAFDTSRETLKVQRQVWKFLKLNRCNTVAVYVATSAERQVATAFDVTLEERYSIYPREELKKRLKAIGASLLEQDIQVISEPGFSLTAAADRIAWRAEDGNYDLILAFTHSRKGPVRWMMGSFAETLLYRSKTPVLLVNPKATLPTRIKRIVFADDLNAKSQAGFDRVIKFAKDFGAEVILYHGAQPIYEFSLTAGDPSVSRYRTKINRTLEKRQAAAAQARVPLKTVIDSSFSDISSRILSLATSEKAEMVAIQAKTGVLGSMLLGSVSRRVVRDSKLPTLVIK